jgi:uncharacterized protein with von Willebrand factor type A (vWA) domain
MKNNAAMEDHWTNNPRFKTQQGTFEQFKEYVEKHCMYEAIYKDSDGRQILVLRLLDAYTMCHNYKEKANDTSNIT